jgi:hypothetical protein
VPVDLVGGMTSSVPARKTRRWGLRLIRWRLKATCAPDSRFVADRRRLAEFLDQNAKMPLSVVGRVSRRAMGSRSQLVGEVTSTKRRPIEGRPEKPIVERWRCEHRAKTRRN